MHTRLPVLDRFAQLGLSLVQPVQTSQRKPSAVMRGRDANGVRRRQGMKQPSSSMERLLSLLKKRLGRHHMAKLQHDGAPLVLQRRRRMFKSRSVPLGGLPIPALALQVVGQGHAAKHLATLRFQHGLFLRQGHLRLRLFFHGLGCKSRRWILPRRHVGYVAVGPSIHLATDILILVGVFHVTSEEKVFCQLFQQPTSKRL
mmetsp:Transcript_62405/g.143771  ORF Transcript_62405/g.143771 Transcript_62405/m.143771 type:complete len:201 (+) Transcript_62405:1211-1813(+)